MATRSRAFVLVLTGIGSLITGFSLVLSPRKITAKRSEGRVTGRWDRETFEVRQQAKRSRELLADEGANSRTVVLVDFNNVRGKSGFSSTSAALLRAVAEWAKSSPTGSAQVVVSRPAVHFDNHRSQ